LKFSQLYTGPLKYFIRTTFSFWEKLGFHITLNHFYQPVPDTRSLSHKVWEKPSEMKGIDLRGVAQCELLESFASRYKKEYDVLPREKTPVPHQYYSNNGAFLAIDAGILYCMVRHFKPKRIFEIGSGNSTYLSAQASLKNSSEDPSYTCELVAMEPYPNAVLRAGFPGMTTLVQKKIQDVPLSEFSKLGENDILFIDSSHVLKTGSDVSFEYLEILPRLNKGVIVHIHDIFLPAEYPKEWILNNHTFWNEQYLLQAFLAFNSKYEVLLGANYMGLAHPDMMEKAFSSYRRGQQAQGSFWIRKVG